MLFLASLRHQSRRFISPGIAVALGVAFITVSLTLGASLTKAVQTALTGDIGRYAVIVTPRFDAGSSTGAGDGSAPSDRSSGRARITPADLATVKSVQGVTDVLAQRSVAVSTGTKPFVILATPPAATSASVVREGRLPSTQTEAAIDLVLAAEEDLTVGSTVEVHQNQPDRATGTNTPGDTLALTVVGLVDTAKDVEFGGISTIFATEKAISTFTRTTAYEELRATSDRDPAQVRDAIAQALGSAPL